MESKEKEAYQNAWNAFLEEYQRIKTQKDALDMLVREMFGTLKGKEELKEETKAHRDLYKVIANK